LTFHRARISTTAKQTNKNHKAKAKQKNTHPNNTEQDTKQKNQEQVSPLSNGRVTFDQHVKDWPAVSEANDALAFKNVCPSFKSSKCQIRFDLVLHANMFEREFFWKQIENKQPICTNQFSMRLPR